MTHSGRYCNFKCAAPCDHLDCVMCMGIKPSPKVSIPKANATPADTARVVAATLKELQAAVPPDEGATTRITRMALEGLASRAGIDVTWREGEPYFSESHTNPLWLNAKEQTLERRLRGLEVENQKLPKEGEAVQLYDAVIAPESAQTMTMIYAKLRAMDRQMDAISGLNDLLAGAPPSVMASGSAIKRLIDRVKL